jgi:hypothetical protein
MWALIASSSAITFESRIRVNRGTISPFRSAGLKNMCKWPAKNELSDFS